MRWRYFITMWAHPRMAAWTVLTALVVAVVRLPFAGMQIIPFAVEFHPGFVLAPAAGVFGGPAGVAGVLLGSLLGDYLAGFWGPVTGWRAAGQVFAALSAHVLWWGGAAGKEERAAPPLRDMLRFAWAGTPGAVAAAAWVALGADVAHLYPFDGVATPLLLNNLFFLVLFAPAVIDFYLRHGLPAFGNWATVMGVDTSLGGSRAGRILVWAGALGAYLLGLVTGGAQPGGPAVLGTWSGWPAYLSVGMCLAVQGVGIVLALRPPRSRPREASPSPRPHLRYLRPME